MATKQQREPHPEGMSPGPVAPGNMPEFPSCKTQVEMGHGGKQERLISLKRAINTASYHQKDKHFRNATMQDQICGHDPFLLLISEKKIKNTGNQSHLSILSLVRFGPLNRVRIT